MRNISILRTSPSITLKFLRQPTTTFLETRSGDRDSFGRAYHKPDARSAGQPACNRSLRHHFAGKVPRTRFADPGMIQKKLDQKKLHHTETLSCVTSLPSVLTWFDHGSRWVKRLRRLPGVTAGRMVGSTLGRVCSPRFPLSPLLHFVLNFYSFFSAACKFPSWYCVRSMRLLPHAQNMVATVRDDDGEYRHSRPHEESPQRSFGARL